MKIRYFLFLLTLLLQTCSEDSDVSSFIDKANADNVERIEVYSMNNVKKLCLHSSNRDTLSIFINGLRNYKKVSHDSAKSQLHNQFFVVDIYFDELNYKEIEIVRGLNGNGYVDAHSGGFIMLNNEILNLLNDLCI